MRRRITRLTVHDLDIQHLDFRGQSSLQLVTANHKTDSRRVTQKRQKSRKRTLTGCR